MHIYIYIYIYICIYIYIYTYIYIYIHICSRFGSSLALPGVRRRLPPDAPPPPVLVRPVRLLRVSISEGLTQASS